VQYIFVAEFGGRRLDTIPQHANLIVTERPEALEGSRADEGIVVQLTAQRDSINQAVNI
jgi:hypothetical protein